MTAAKVARINELLPFLDPQQAAALLIWHRQQGLGEVLDGALKSLLEAYPLEWAAKELGWQLDRLPIDSNYQRRTADGFWHDLSRATLALRTSEPDSSFDFESTPRVLRDAFQTLESRLVVSGTQAAKKQNAEVMHQIAWLLHYTFWILLRYYVPHIKVKGGPVEDWTEVIDCLFTDKVTQTVTMVCPHLIRYYAALILPDRKRTEHVWFILSLIGSLNGSKLEDPIVQFTKSIFSDSNIGSAKALLAQLQHLDDDFFLADESLGRSLFQDSRLLVFEHFCRAHQSLSFDAVLQLAAPGELDAADEEQQIFWIVNLIRDAKVDATVDTAARLVRMAAVPTNPYAAIIEKSKSTFYKTNQLIKNLSA